MHPTQQHRQEQQQQQQQQQQRVVDVVVEKLHQRASRRSLQRMVDQDTARAFQTNIQRDDVIIGPGEEPGMGGGGGGGGAGGGGRESSDCGGRGGSCDGCGGGAFEDSVNFKGPSGCYGELIYISFFSWETFSGPLENYSVL